MEPEINDPFAPVNVDETPDMQTKVQPFTATQRFIVQNFFDTNDTARKKYLKQMGYELDPQDDNLIRSIGTKGKYVPIDPGFSDVFKKNGVSGLAKEFLQDAGDVTYDLSDIGAKVLSSLGGGLAGSLPGAVVGAAASGALSNSAKQGIRNMLLDEDMPFDAKEVGLDATLSALGAGIFGGAAKGLRKLKDFDIQTRIDGIKNALKAAGNVSDPNLIEKAAQNPEMFTEEAVKGGKRKLYEATKNIFGLEEGDQLRDIKDLKRARPDSYFGKILNPLAKAQDDAYNSLSLDRNASVSYADAKQNLEGAYQALESKVLQGNPTQAESEAFEVLGEQLGNLKKMAAANIGKKPGEAVPDSQLANVSFNFGQARQFLDGLQDRAFNVTTKSSNPIVRQVAGGVRTYLDDVAVKSGNPVGKLLPELNAKMSEVLDDYNTAKDLIGSSDKIMRAYVGKPGERAIEVQDLMQSFDGKYGTNLAKDFDALSAQSVFEDIYRGGTPKGSSMVNAFMVGEVGKGVGKGAGLGAFAGSVVPGVGTGVGAALGGIAGGVKAAKNAATLANPEKGLRALGGMLEQQAARSAMDPAELAIKDALTSGAGGAALSQVGSVEGEDQEIDPFAPVRLD